MSFCNAKHAGSSFHFSWNHFSDSYINLDQDFSGCTCAETSVEWLKMLEMLTDLYEKGFWVFTQWRPWWRSGGNVAALDATVYKPEFFYKMDDLRATKGSWGKFRGQEYLQIYLCITARLKWQNWSHFCKKT